MEPATAQTLTLEMIARNSPVTETAASMGTVWHFSRFLSATAMESMVETSARCCSASMDATNLTELVTPPLGTVTAPTDTSALTVVSSDSVGPGY